MERPFIFFDLGQTLVDEWNFIDYLDHRLLEILNAFGAKIDIRNYKAVRDNIIKSHKIGNGSARELIIEVCKLISQRGYNRIIADKLENDIKEARRKLFRFFDDVQQTLSVLSQRYELGIIANQSKDILELLDEYNLKRFFKVTIISSEVKMKEPDPEIFQLAMDRAAHSSKYYIMVGDRLDIDISPANKLGMKTIRYTNSLFRLQDPMDEFEKATYTVDTLSEIPYVLKRIINS